MDARALRRRRRAYARRARLGFEGYRIGSAVHLFQAVLQPGPRQAVAQGLLAVGLLALGITLTAAGAAPGAALGLAVLVAWTVAGMLRFWYEVREVRRLRPPGWPDGAGVREPRRPPPGAGELRATRELPPAPPEA